MQRTIVAGALLLGAGALLLGACAGGDAVPFQALDPASTTGAGAPSRRLSEHAERGAALRDAVVRGDLAGSKRNAQALVTLGSRERMNGGSPRVGAMVEAAKTVRDAQDLPAAAAAFGELSARCGDCHAAYGAGPRSVPRPLSTEDGPEWRMRRHQWGAARMWEGLVAPSDEAWRSGALAIAEAPLEPATLTPGKTADPRLVTLAGAVHDLGRSATSVPSPTARATLYGQLVATCASCHAWLGGGPQN